MGTYSTWIDYITDPSAVGMEVMQALQALDVVIDELYQAEYILFDYNNFFSSNVTNVGEALRELADAVEVGAKQVITIPSYGTALVNSTMIAEALVHKDAVLGLGQLWLSTAPAGTACTIFVMKNGSSVYTFSFEPGAHGPKELDLSFVTVVKGDVLGLFCDVASGAVGLSATLEL